MLEALGTVTAALVEDRPYKPDFADLYRVLVRYALAPAAGPRSGHRTMRAGHSVDVLLGVYANCIDGDDEIANQRVSGVLS
jgi:hypothetical protein